MNRIIILFLCLASTISYSQELPRDLLDTNAAFIYNPTVSKENFQETMQFFCNSIVKSGFNLTGKYLYTDTQTSLMEMEMDIRNKKIKYIFLLIDVPNKKPTYKLFLFEHNSENQNITNPKEGLYTFKPNTKEKIYDELYKVAHNNLGYDIDNKAYNNKLINTFVLKEQDIKILKKVNEINTFVDGSFLFIEKTTLPTDMDKHSLVYIAVTKDEYRGYQTINSYFKNKMTNYPYDFIYYDSYKDYKSDGGDKKYKYRIQLVNKDIDFINSLKETIKYVHSADDLKNESPVPYFGGVPTEAPRDHFTILVKNNLTQERHVGSTFDHLGNSIRYFVEQLKK